MPTTFGWSPDYRLPIPVPLFNMGFGLRSIRHQAITNETLTPSAVSVPAPGLSVPWFFLLKPSYPEPGEIFNMQLTTRLLGFVLLFWADLLHISVDSRNYQRVSV
ncbi:hypothetical protein NXS19_005050 [Fusarium pseudograminearum]|nr:hypothetical protein NXS19_005050 [Fusarium pseudograminearum]